jgi:hypothetical protein
MRVVSIDGLFLPWRTLFQSLATYFSKGTVDAEDDQDAAVGIDDLRSLLTCRTLSSGPFT